MTVLRKSFYIHWSAGRSPRVHEVNPGLDPSARIYKKKTKRWHDQKILRREFKAREQVLLYNSKLKLFPGKLKSRWSGPYIVVTSTPFEAVTLKTESRSEFKVNSQRLKHYLGGSIKEVDPDFEKRKENY